MRRKDRQLSEEETRAILERGVYGALSLCHDDKPYGIPLNYVMSGNYIYFHAALEGRKLEMLNENPRASFLVVGENKVIEDSFTMAYESAIVSGNIRIVYEDDEKKEALLKFIEKYSLAYYEQGKAFVEKNLGRTLVLSFFIDEMTGKSNPLGRE